MKKLLQLLFILAAVAPLGAQTRTMLKTPPGPGTGDNALLESFATGSQKITVSALGTLEFKSGFTLTGGGYLKAALMLDNVENTALSTWGGSAAMTTLGTITMGVWHGTAIADANISSAAAWNAKQPGSALLSAIASLGNTAGVPTNDGSGNWSYGPAIPSPSGLNGYYLKSNGSAWVGSQLNVLGALLSGGSPGNILFNNAGVVGGLAMVPVANGGTGQNASFSNGQLLIGNTTGGTLAKATLTAGSGITVTNGAGSITLSIGSGAVTNSMLVGTDITKVGTLTAGTIPTTLLSGTITSAQLAGSIDLTTKVTGILPVANGGTGINALGSGVSPALGNAVNAASGLLTYDLVGTSGTKLPLLSAGNTFGVAQSIDVASGTQLTLKLTGTAFTYFTDNGLYLGMPGVSGYQVRLCSNWGSLGLFSGNYISYNYGLHYRATGGSGEIEYFNIWDTGSANQMDLRYYTSPQVLRVTNTWSSSTSWESFVIDWQTSTNVARIGTDKGSGGGSARDVSVIQGGTEKMRISSSGVAIGTTGTAHSKVKSGVATLVAGTVTISDSDVLATGTATTSSRIIVTRQTDGGTMGDSYSITRVNATSFTITAKSAGSTQTADTSTVSWLLINP